MELWPGNPSPPGATWDGQGTNFALFSERATSVDLCLFDDDRLSGSLGRFPTSVETRLPLTEVDGHVWHGYVPGVMPGPALRLPGRRALGAPPGPALQPVQAPRRPLRPGHRRPPRLARGRLRPQLGRSRRPARPPRLGPPRPPVGGGRHPLPVGRRHPPPHPVARHRDLRAARQGVHRPPSRRAPPPAGHLRRPGQPPGDRLPGRAGRHRGRAHARPPLRVGAATSCAGA